MDLTLAEPRISRQYLNLTKLKELTKIHPSTIIVPRVLVDNGEERVHLAAVLLGNGHEGV